MASLEDFDLDCPLLGFDNGNDVAVLNLISGLDQPLNKGARLHIGAERGHAELGHRTPPMSVQARLSPPRRSWVLAGSPQSQGAGDKG